MAAPGLPRLRLRSRIVLLVLLGGVLPLAVWGWWVLTATERAGEELLRTRLDESLAEVARSVGLNWIGARSVLVDLAETQDVREALAGAPVRARAPGELGIDWGVLEGAVDRITLRDARGRAVFEVARPVGPRPSAFVLPPVRLPVRSPASAAVVGELSAVLDADVLLPPNALLPSVSGAVLAVLAPGGSEGNVPLALDPALLREDRFFWGGQEWLAARREITEPAFTLAMAGPLTPFARPLETASRRALGGLLLAVAVGVAAALVLSARVAGPLERLGRAADRVSAGVLDVEVEPEGPDEVFRVGRAFNQMTENLRRTLERAARKETLAEVGAFAATLAHEIRNPLTSVRLDLERAEEGLPDHGREARLVRRALDEVERLDQSVTGTLRLARSGTVERAPVDIAEPVRDAIEAARPLFTARGATLSHLSAPPRASGPLVVEGDRGALRQVVFNLLENAATAVEPGGRAEVLTEIDGTDAVVEIRDDGRGMTEDELARAVEILHTRRTGGTGLGLPLARRITEAHGGRLELESVAGDGTVARIRIPLAHQHAGGAYEDSGGGPGAPGRRQPRQA